MKTLVALFAGVLVILADGAHVSVRAQESTHLPRVGYLGENNRGNNWATFVRTMHDSGYIDGQTVALEGRFAGGRRERLAPLARDLAASRVDVIVAIGDEATAAAQSATKTIPIVMLTCDAVTVGFVASLARPGGNTTGVTCLTAELSAKRVQVFREALPALKRIAVLYNPENQSKPFDFQQTRDAAASLGIDVRGFELREPGDIDRAFAELAANPPDGVSVLDESFTLFHARRIADLAHAQRLPVMHSFREAVDAGGLLSYGPDLNDMMAVATRLIPKILKGARPADLPVEQPTKFELVINMKTAKALGLTVPPSLLARADEVIE